MQAATKQQSDSEPVRVAIMHPVGVWVDGLESLLRPRSQVDVTSAHTDPAWVRHAVAAQRADVLLLSIEPPGELLDSLVPDLLNADPHLGVIALSESENAELLVAAVRAGVRGWVRPTATVEHLVEVLRGVHEGETWFPPALLTRLLDELLSEPEVDEGAAILSILSARETEILQCLVQGMSRRQIADLYVLSPHTVRTHINNLLRKLGVHSTLAAVSIARQAGVSSRASHL